MLIRNMEEVRERAGHAYSLGTISAGGGAVSAG